MVELRKRPAPAEPLSRPAKKASKPKPETNGKDEVKPAKKVQPKSVNTIKVGDIIDLDGFGGEVLLHTGEATTLKKLLDKAKSGIVLFSYPRASTPGCTRQAQGFGSSKIYPVLTSTGLDIYGLSRDSPKANTTFKTKLNLPYPLLCDKDATLLAAIGLKNGDKTTRGVFVIGKDGKVLAAQPGSPEGTIAVVEGIVSTQLY